MKFRSMLLILFMGSTVHAWAAPGETQHELRLPLSLDNYLKMARVLGFDLTSNSGVAKRHDTYFDIFDGEQLLLRSDPELPIKMRLKNYGSGVVWWQVSQRIVRNHFYEPNPLVTFTELSSHEIKMSRKAAAVILQAAHDYDVSLRRGKSRAAELLGEVHAALREADIDHLPGYSLVGPQLAKGVLVPLYRNTKTKRTKEITLGGLPMTVQLRHIVYYYGADSGVDVFELEAEPAKPFTGDESLRAGMAFVQWIESKGIDLASNIPLTFDHCAAVAQKLKLRRADILIR